MNNTIIGTRIAELRKSAGEKQEDLAEVLGCNRGSLANYETGKRTPDVETIIKIAQHYGTTTDYILGVTDNKTVHTTLQAVAEYTGLSDKAITVLRLLNEIKKDKEKYESIKEKSKQFSDGTNTYELSANKAIYGIDFIDWCLRKMDRFYPGLYHITHMVNVKHLKGNTSHAGADELIELIYEQSPEIADLIYSTGAIITGIQYRQLLLQECEREFGFLLRDFAAEISPFEELEHDFKITETFLGGAHDLKVESEEIKNLYEKMSEDLIKNYTDKKDSDT